MKKDNLSTLVSLFFSTGQILREKLNLCGDTSTFSHLQLKALQFVESTQNCNMKDLATCLHITAPSATSLTNTLVKSGQLTRVHDTNDRRVVHLVCTPKGKKVMRNGIEYVHTHMREIFSVLTDTEMTQFIQILRKISDTHTSHT